MKTKLREKQQLLTFSLVWERESCWNCLTGSLEIIKSPIFRHNMPTRRSILKIIKAHPIYISLHPLLSLHLLCRFPPCYIFTKSSSILTTLALMYCVWVPIKNNKNQFFLLHVFIYMLNL